jgi:hypothetical protein
MPALKVNEGHFKPNILHIDMKAEVAAVAAADDVRSFQPLPGPFLQQLSQFYVLVKNAADLDKLPQQLKGDREFGFCPMFCPRLFDEACQRGLFPLAVDVHRNVFVFAPKCHVERGVTRLEPKACIDGLRFPDDDDGNFIESNLPVSGKLARRCSVAVNRLEDVADVLDLIHRQHGENWLCQRLRALVIHMLLHAAEYHTKIVLVAVRDVESNVLVACEYGYIAGDIYTSGTGAYRVSGAGSLQLRALAELLRSSLGVRLWDLGMLMDYKNKTLGCTAVPRKQWLACVKARVSKPDVAADVARRLLGLTGHVFSAAQLVKSSSDNPLPCVPAGPAVDSPQSTLLPLSKSQAKKAAKAQWLAARKAGQDPASSTDLPDGTDVLSNQLEVTK